MVDVFYKGRTYAVPECWDELSGSQFVQIVRVLFEHNDLWTARVQLVGILLGLSHKQICKMSAETLLNAQQLTGWIESTCDASCQLLPCVKAPKKMYGPKAAFENVTAVEFHAADMYYLSWRDGCEEDLFNFLAVLYRPAKKKYNICLNPSGDVREPFNPNLTAHYAAQLRRLDRGAVMAIVVQYESWRRNLEQEYPKVFKKNSSATDGHTGWFAVFRGIANEQKYGAMDEVEQMPIGTVLLELTMLLEEEEALKTRYPDLYK